MSLLIVLIVLIVSCIFYILFLRLWNIFSVIILNYFSGSFLISSLFIWSCEFLPCFLICPIFLCLFFFLFFFFYLTPFEVSFSQTLGLYPFFLLVFAFSRKGCFSGLCWFLARSDLSLCCSGGSELFYYFLSLFFLMEKAVWGSIIWSVCVNPVAGVVFLLLSCQLIG